MATGSELRMNVAIDDIDEAITKETFQGMLWGEDRLWSPLMGGEDVWPVADPAGPRPETGPLSKPDRVCCPDRSMT